MLDVGCAEGLISFKCSEEGAESVHGVEIVPDHVEAARRFAAKRSIPKHCTFEVGDANVYTPRQPYDIILMLAVLHKLRDPSAACARLVAHARTHVVIRLPPAGAPVIVDARSGGTPHDIGAVMKHCGFMEAFSSLDGPFGEWVGYYRRNT